MSHIRSPIRPGLEKQGSNVMRRLQVMCQKTKFCSFHARGMCTRGAACAFAHGEHELKQTPDLTRTKPCRTLLRTGVCSDNQCAFAHHQEEIRRFPVNSYPHCVPDAASDGHERMASSRSMYPADPPQCRRQVVEQDTIPKMDPKAVTWMPHYQPLPPSSSPSMLLLPMPLPSMQLSATSATSPENDVALEHHEVCEPSHTTWAGLGLTAPSSVSMDVTDHGAGRPSVGVGGAGLPSVAVDFIDRAAGPRSNKFQKTKLCTAFFAGRCTKRGRCNFAHSEEEVRPLPNLSQTKLCPNLVCSESCNDPGCTFAHSPEQIRQWHDNNALNARNARNAVMLDAEHEEKGGERQEVMLERRQYQAEDEDSDEDEESQEQGGDHFPKREDELGSIDLDMSESDLLLGQVSGDIDISFHRQHTEDPVALYVRQMRVKNTFITIDEDESSQVAETKPPRRRRARSAPAVHSGEGGCRFAESLQADTSATSKPVLGFPEPLMTAQATDTGTEGQLFPASQAADARIEAPLFPASEGPSVDFVLVNDPRTLPRLPRPSSPPPRRFHHVEGSSGPALSTPSLVASASLSQAENFAGVMPRTKVPAHSLAPFKDSPVRVDSDLGDWPVSQSLPYFAQEPQYIGEPHFVQPRWGPPGPKSKLAWPQGFPLDYNMSRNQLLSSARPMAMPQLSCHVMRQR